MNKEIETVGDRLRYVRGEINQSDFSIQMGISLQSLGRYERNQRPPDSEFLTRLYEIKAVNITWLLTGFGQPYVVSNPHDPQTLDELIQKVSPLIDTNLSGRIYDKVFKAYKENNVPVSPLEMGRRCADIYNELVMAHEDPDDRLIALGSYIDRLIRDLRNPIDQSGTAKQAG